MSLKSIATVAAVVTAASVSQASAQGMTTYIGGGYEYSNAVSTAIPSGDASRGALSSLLVVGGMEMDLGSYFLGGEIGLGIGLGATLTPDSGGVCGVLATGPYGCALDYSMRARAILGVDLGSVGVFGSIGGAMVSGTFATSPLVIESATISGLTYGIGARYEISNGLSLRGEVIWDNLTTSTQVGANDSTWTDTSFQVTLIKSF